MVTPWQRVFKKLGLSQSELAREIGRDRSKISKALRNGDGLINGRDQKQLLSVARRRKIKITLNDFTPKSGLGA